jgi:hypothetical protein
MKTSMQTLGLCALAAIVAGCAPVAPHWESSFGNAVRATVASQVADPAAARNANPVAGIDGRAAQAAQQHYEASFRTPSKQEPVMISGSAK